MANITHRRSYSSIYQIYRRFRFLRYRKKLAKRLKAEQARQVLDAEQEVRRNLAEFRSRETEQNRLKQKALKKEEKRIREEQLREFKTRELMAREELKRHLAAEEEKLKEQRKQEQKEQNLRTKEAVIRRKHRRRAFLRSFTVPALRERFEEFRKNAPKRRLIRVISLNSTVLFLLSYFILYLIYQAVTTIAGFFFNYPVILYYYEVYFNISLGRWYHDSVKTIYSAGPLMLFLVGIISMIIYSNLRDLTGNLKLFFLWSFLHGINMLFGALLVGTLFDTGVGYVLSWMYVQDTGRVLYSIISIFMIVIAGLASVKPFLISGNHYFNYISSENRTLLMFSQVILPFLLGNIIIFLVRTPHFMFYETFTCLVMAISILAMISTYRNYHELYFDEEIKEPRFDWRYLAALIGVILFYRGVLQFGIRIGG